jgi:peptide/nickel transport system substrate-binding protein
MNRADDGSPVPFLLEGWDLDRDAMTLTMYLKEGIWFHDGTPLNAEAVIWCAQALIDSGQNELPNVGSLEALDEYTVRVTMSSWDVLMVNYFVLKAGNMYSPTAIQTHDPDWGLDHACATGPFEFESFEKDVRLKYVRNDDYWQEGKPYLDSIEWIFVQDVMTRVASFKAGEAQVVTGLTAVQANELEKTGDYVVVKAPTQIFSLYMDSVNEDSPWYKVEVRQAAAHAINNQEICDAFGYGFYEPANQIGYVGYPAYNPDIIGYPYDPDLARQMLADAGYPDGFDTTIWYTSGGDDSIFQAVQGYWEEVGIHVTLEVVDFAKLLEISTQGWHNGIQTFLPPFVPIGYPPAKNITFTFSPDSIFSVSVIRPDEVEELKIQALGADTEEECNEICKEINRLLVDKYCVLIPIFVSPSIAAKVPWLHDDEIDTKWQEQWFPADAWLEHD